jgi:hypothetical protein
MNGDNLEIIIKISFWRTIKDRGQSKDEIERLVDYVCKAIDSKFSEEGCLELDCVKVFREE